MTNAAINIIAKHVIMSSESAVCFNAVHYLFTIQLTAQGSFVTSFEKGSKFLPQLPAEDDIICTFNGCILQRNGCWAYLPDEVQCLLGI